jgi:hypothetical protein
MTNLPARSASQPTTPGDLVFTSASSAALFPSAQADPLETPVPGVLARNKLKILHHFPAISSSSLSTTTAPTGATSLLPTRRHALGDIMPEPMGAIISERPAGFIGIRSSPMAIELCIEIRAFSSCLILFGGIRADVNRGPESSGPFVRRSSDTPENCLSRRAPR